MASFRVELNITNKKELTIYARDEDEAQHESRGPCRAGITLS